MESTFDKLAKAFVQYLINGGKGRSIEQREAYLDALKLNDIASPEDAELLRCMVTSSILMSEFMDHAIPPDKSRVQQFMNL